MRLSTGPVVLEPREPWGSAAWGVLRRAAVRPCPARPAQLLLVGFLGPVSRGWWTGVGRAAAVPRQRRSAGQVRAPGRPQGTGRDPAGGAVDQEPGTKWPAWRDRPGRAVSPRAGPPAADRVERYGRAAGRDLAALGITADLAPVLDVTGARWDGIIGDRLGADPATVSRAAVAYMRGLAAGGVAPSASTSPATAPQASTPTTGCRS